MKLDMKKFINILIINRNSDNVVKVYCAKCGRFSWEIDMVPGKQIVKCPECHKKTNIYVYHGDMDVLKVKTW